MDESTGKVYPAPYPHESDRPPGPAAERFSARVVALAEVLLCSSVPTSLLIGQLMALAGLPPAMDNPLSLVVLLLADTILVTALMVWRLRVHGERPRDLWLGRRPMGREAALGLLLVPVVYLLVTVTLNAIRLWAPWLHNLPRSPLEEIAAAGTGEAAALALAAVLAGGVREEMQRAFLLSRFERHLGGAAAGVVVLSVAFGLGHYAQGWDATVATALIGAFWAVVYLRRRSIVAPLVSHAGFNLSEVLRVASGAV